MSNASQAFLTKVEVRAKEIEAAISSGELPVCNIRCELQDAFADEDMVDIAAFTHVLLANTLG